MVDLEVSFLHGFWAGSVRAKQHVVQHDRDFNNSQQTSGRATRPLGSLFTGVGIKKTNICIKRNKFASKRKIHLHQKENKSKSQIGKEKEGSKKGRKEGRREERKEGRNKGRSKGRKEGKKGRNRQGKKSKHCITYENRYCQSALGGGAAPSPNPPSCFIHFSPKFAFFFLSHYSMHILHV